jgi:hypothetical protein
MTSFPGSPNVRRGAIVGIDPLNPLAGIIIFQYNPETMRRTLTAQRSESQQNQREAQRLKGPPKESISLAVEIDATDQLERADPTATSFGIHPTLAALEMLLYPKSALVIANEVLAAFGVIEIIPPQAPLTLLVWGEKRVVPIRLTQFTIEEQMYDTNLNPIRARVDLGIDVLSYQDLGLTSVGGSIFMAHQVVKETMATLGSINGTLSSL